MLKRLLLIVVLLTGVSVVSAEIRFREIVMEHSDLRDSVINSFRDTLLSLPEGENYILRTIPREYIMNRVIGHEPPDSIVRLQNIWDHPLYFSESYGKIDHWFRSYEDKFRPYRFRNHDGTLSETRYEIGKARVMKSKISDVGLISFYFGKSNLLRLSVITPSAEVYERIESVVTPDNLEVLENNMQTDDVYLIVPQLSIPIDCQRQTLYDTEPPTVQENYLRHSGANRRDDFVFMPMPRVALTEPFIFVITETKTDKILAIGIVNSL